MARHSPETHAKRARELAVKERRERKRAKKAEAAANRAASRDSQMPNDGAAEPEAPEARDQSAA